MVILNARHGSLEYLEAVALRRKILRLPLGLDFTEEELANEDRETHLVGLIDGKVIACLVMVPLTDGVIKMRQVAVDDGLRGMGLGAKLVQASERWAVESGFSRIELNARDTAVSFYDRLGYRPAGDGFVEVGIPHQKMVKDLVGNRL